MISYYQATCNLFLKKQLPIMFKIRAQFFVHSKDASKAFDKLHYCELFKLIVKREMPALFVRLLANIYTQNLLEFLGHASRLQLTE